MTTKPVTFDHLKSQKKPATVSTWIMMDGEDLDINIDDLRQKVEVSKMAETANPTPQNKKAIKDAEKEFQAAQVTLREHAIKFVLRSIGRKKYETLLDKHPPTEEERESGDSWNVDTFPPALVAACLVEPELTEAQVQELWDDENWSNGDWMSLFQLALTVNASRRIVDLGNV